MDQNFSKRRAFLWPIHKSEMAKFMPLGLMMFFVLFNYTTLRSAKDSLVITGCGAEVVPFLKGWIILPISILFVAGYSKLVNRYSQQSLFYGIISAFLIYFSLFALYIYPNRELLHPDPGLIYDLKQSYPHFQHLISLYGSWSYSTFYVFAESWGAIALGLLFWQFANEITSTTEAKRFYGMLAFLGHFGLILAGYMATRFCSSAVEGGAVDGWADYFKMTIMAVNVGGFIIMGLYWWLNNKVLTNPKHMPAEHERKSAKPKLKLSVAESFRRIIKSRYIGYIAIMVFGYGFTMNLMGLMWKNQVKLNYPDPLQYADFMGNFYMLTGVTTVGILFFFKGVVSKFGWFRGAIISPLAILITSFLFFMFIFYQDFLTPFVALFGSTPILVMVWIASFQQVMSKGCKYSLFDPTKEMSYIPLDPEMRSKGKAAVDVTGQLFGKASGGYFMGGILIITAASDLMVVAPIIAVAVMLTLVVWVWAVFKLSADYDMLTKVHERPLVPGDEFKSDANPVKRNKKAFV